MAQDEQPSFSQRMLYGLSLPERVLRSTAGVLGGTLRDSAEVLLPAAFRNAQTYRAFVGQMLDFLADQVGQVDAPPTATPGGQPQDYLARKTVGNFVDVASLATLHLSPMLLLALVADVAYGSKTYLREVAAEMEQQGVIDDAAKVDRVDDLLEQVAGASRQAATAFDLPPLSLEGLRQTVQETRAAVAAIDPSTVLPERELAAFWRDLQASARRQGVSAFNVSGLVTLGALDRVAKVGTGALSTAQATGNLFDRHVLDHYRGVLRQVDQDGFYPTLRTVGRPYLQAAWANFAPQRRTVTERLLRQLAAHGKELARSTTTSQGTARPGLRWPFRGSRRPPSR